MRPELKIMPFRLWLRNGRWHVPHQRDVIVTLAPAAAGWLRTLANIATMHVSCFVRDSYGDSSKSIRHRPVCVKWINKMPAIGFADSRPT